MNLSKSKYTLGKRCEKLLWLSLYKQDEAEDMGNDAVLENGNKIGDYARHLFGDDYILIDYNKGFESMIEDTKKYLEDKPNIICEASFSYNGNFCSIDILKNDIDGVEIYEVKSSTEVKDIYIDDITYQTWILKKCGLNVKKSYLVYVNNHYIKNGELDIHKYFNIEDVTNLLKLDEVDNNVDNFSKIINQDDEPNNDLTKSCKQPYDCPFFSYCTKKLPKPNVFDVGWGVHFSKKLKMYYDNKVTYSDILETGEFNSKANEQMEFELNNLSPKIYKVNIKKFLSELKYPLYFLDFESYQVDIPKIDGTWPYQQICFQYSLHILYEDGKIEHKEFLSDDYDGNPMLGLCKKLCDDIPLNSCVIVYNDKFEKTRLREMARLFPEFSNYLLNIESNIVDLFPIFNNHDYYVKEIGSSASIKKVLPALFPNDQDLDYHNLEQVHKGDEASQAFLNLKYLEETERNELRKNMLKYCCLDTYAMVKIYEKLKEEVR